MDQAEGMQAQNVTAPVPVPQEKMLPQSEVDRIVGGQKQEAYERGRREALAAAQPHAQGMGGMPAMSDEKIRQIVAEEAQKRAHLQDAQRVTHDFVSKMEGGKGKYSDFERTVAELDLQSNPHLVHLAANVGNTPDVMYHLGKNPSKVATLTTLAYVNPRLAQAEMQRLSDSLKQNEEATKAPEAKEPLSQVQPSTVGTDNGVNSVRDLRRKAWARA